MNAICQALNYIAGTKTGLIIYDVCCQWIIYFMEKISQSRFLTLPENFKITPAVGKFHLGAHIRECFYKFSLNLIEGLGQIDGEIMETLWAFLDKVLRITRSASAAHCHELMDDYMGNGNWKKLVQISTHLCLECVL